MQTLFSPQKLLGGHGKISVTSSYLKIIKFYLVFQCRWDSYTTLLNFTLKFQAIAEKTANYFGDNFFCRTWCMWLGGLWTRSAGCRLDFPVLHFLAATLGRSFTRMAWGINHCNRCHPQSSVSRVEQTI